MTDQLAEAREFRAYWFTLKATGVRAIDAILKEIAAAGKAAHSTEFWGGQVDSYIEVNYIERIQEAANVAALSCSTITDEQVAIVREVLAIPDCDNPSFFTWHTDKDIRDALEAAARVRGTGQ